MIAQNLEADASTFRGAARQMWGFRGGCGCSKTCPSDLRSARGNKCPPNVRSEISQKCSPKLSSSFAAALAAAGGGGAASGPSGGQGQGQHMRAALEAQRRQTTLLRQQWGSDSERQWGGGSEAAAAGPGPAEHVSGQGGGLAAAEHRLALAEKQSVRNRASRPGPWHALLTSRTPAWVGWAAREAKASLLVD